MSDKPDGRNPFEQGEGETRSVIKGLVETAADTRRKTEQESDRKTPRYPSEVERVERRVSLDLDPEVKEALYSFVEEVAGSKRRLSAIAQALIVYGLEACQEGRLKLEPQLNSGGIGFVVVESEDNGK